MTHSHKADRQVTAETVPRMKNLQPPTDGPLRNSITLSTALVRNILGFVTHKEGKTRTRGFGIFEETTQNLGGSI